MATASLKRRAITIDLEIDALMDQRFETLGNVAGYNRYEAHGRMFALWAWVLEKQPEGYIVTEGVVRSFLGPQGVDAILASGCDELALGEEREGGIYVRGSHRFEWLKKKREAAKMGGEARKNAPRNPDGTFNPSGTHNAQNDITQPATSQPPASHNEPTHQPPRSETPATSQPLSSPLSSIPEDPCGVAPRTAATPAGLKLQNPEAPEPNAAKRPPHPDHGAGRGLWLSYWARKANGVKPTWGAKQAALLNGMLRQHGIEEVERRMRLLESSTDAWHRGWDFAAFAQHSDRLVAGPINRNERGGGHTPLGEPTRRIPVAQPRLSEDT